jgi:uncharacterized protein YigE (DUF2233 family)
MQFKFGAALFILLLLLLVFSKQIGLLYPDFTFKKDTRLFPGKTTGIKEICKSSTQTIKNKQNKKRDSIIGKVVTDSLNAFDIVIARYPECKIRMIYKDQKGNQLGNMNNALNFLNRTSKALFITNAGIFNPDQQPKGLYIEEGCIIVPLENHKKGYGNFYLQPNGIFLLTARKAYIVPTNKLYLVEHEIKYATQSGPLLLYKGEINSQFNQFSRNKVIRSGVGITADGEVIFVLSKNPVSFYDLAMVFKSRLNCITALYLDGYISKMYFPPLNLKNLDGKFSAFIAITE